MPITITSATELRRDGIVLGKVFEAFKNNKLNVAECQAALETYEAGIVAEKERARREVAEQKGISLTGARAAKTALDANDTAAAKTVVADMIALTATSRKQRLQAEIAARQAELAKEP